MAEPKDKDKDKGASVVIGSFGRSVNYPYITLESAIADAQKFRVAAGKNRIPVASAATAWGYSEKSSGVRSTVSALKQYGLLQDIGDGDKRQLQLTERALDVLFEPLESPKRAAAIMDAALAPKIYSDILKRFPEGLPADHIISAYLQREKDFNPKTVASFIRDFRANLVFAKVPSSGTMPESKDGKANGEGPKVKAGDYIQWESGGVVQFVPPKQVSRLSPDGKFVFVEDSETGLPIVEVEVVDAPPMQPAPKPAMSPRGFKQDVYTLGEEGQVILQWPEKMSAESYAELEDWIALQMRKIARLNSIKVEEKK